MYILTQQIQRVFYFDFVFKSSLSVSYGFRCKLYQTFLSAVFCSTLQAQLIAQSIGQAFSVAYQEFLRANGINPEDLSQKEYSDIINTQEMYNDDLIHFSNSENCKEVNQFGNFNFQIDPSLSEESSSHRNIF